MDNPVSQTAIVKTRWGLGSKLAVVGLPFLMAGLLSTVATLWVSWQLDGGAAAVNEAGRMRMQAYRMAFVVSSQERGELIALEKNFHKASMSFAMEIPSVPCLCPGMNKCESIFLMSKPIGLHSNPIGYQREVQCQPVTRLCCGLKRCGLLQT